MGLGNTGIANSFHGYVENTLIYIFLDQAQDPEKITIIYGYSQESLLVQVLVSSFPDPSRR